MVINLILIGLMLILICICYMIFVKIKEFSKNNEEKIANMKDEIMNLHMRMEEYNKEIHLQFSESKIEQTVRNSENILQISELINTKINSMKQTVPDSMESIRQMNEKKLNEIND